MMTKTEAFPIVNLSYVESNEGVCGYIKKKNEYMLVDLAFNQLSITKIKTFRGQEFTVKDQVTRRVSTTIHVPLLLKDKLKMDYNLCSNVRKRYGIDANACSHVATCLTDYARNLHDDCGVDDEGKIFKIRGFWGLVLEGVCEERVSDLIESTCAICLDDLSARGECTRTICSHIFHDGCINSWLNKNNTCPVCRRKIDNDYW